MVKKAEATIENGYLKLNRSWKKGDVIDLVLDMPVRKVIANEKLKSNHGKVAIERGPVLYCAEGHDNGGKALAIKISGTQEFTPTYQKEMLGGINVLKSKEQNITLIPYYAWANRGANEMTIWFGRQ